MKRLICIATTTACLGFAQGAGGQGADVLLNCTSCHMLAPDPASAETTRMPPSPYPDLSGQPARYLEHQLEAYRNGLRRHPQMQATATTLDKGAAAMARMYADAPAPDLVFRDDPDDHAAAQRLVFEGDWSRGLAPCASCHAMAPEDRARLSPRLHSHPAPYLTRQLRAYANGTRRSDTMGRMRAISSRLSEQEISELAAYYAAWQPEAAHAAQQQEDDPDG